MYPNTSFCVEQLEAGRLKESLKKGYYSLIILNNFDNTTKKPESTNETLQKNEAF